MPDLADYLPYLTRVESKHRASLFQKANVCGVVKGYKQRGGSRTDIPSLVILVTKKLAPLQLQAADLIPAMIDNMPTDVVEVGVIRALDYRMEHQRPCKGGISVGHYPLVTAGTLTSWFKVDGVNWALSNNHVFAACLDSTTEILTENGWKLFKDLEVKEKVATLSAKMELEYQLPTKYIEQRYTGDMMLFEGKFHSLMVTPNHRLFAKKTFTTGYYGESPKFIDFQRLPTLEAIKRIENTKTISMTSAFRWNCAPIKTMNLPKVEYIKGKDFNLLGTINSEHWLPFMGWFLSEGCVTIREKLKQYIVQISNTDKKYLAEILALCRNMGFTAFEMKNAIRITNKQLALYLKQFGKCKDKFVPKDIKMAPPYQLKLFLDAFIKGDGHRAKYGHIMFVSKSKRLMDDLQEIGMKLGYGTRTFIRSGMGTWSSGSTYYHLSLKKRTEWVQHRKPLSIPYSGKVYCVSVPNQIIMVRRNGFPIWTGNSNAAKKGDPITQPGKHDGGVWPADEVATLERFVPIKFIEQNSCPIARGVASVFNLPLKGLKRKSRFAVRQEVMNRVDCALARAHGVNIVDDEVYELGILKGWRKLQVGDEIRKSGRTTGVTIGVIDYIGTVQVSYGSAGVAFFEEQFVSLSMLCAGGDSGSPVDDRHLLLGGLLFAGSDTSTILNQIEHVWNELNFHPLSEVT